MKYAIEVNDIWKKYRIYQDRSPTLKEKVLFRNRAKYEDLWVLKGVNLLIEKGKSIGLVGQNGSGKSTLLKVLTRIIYPEKGSLEINGKVSSLLELGAGFHPDFTGMENIYMNAAIFGMTKKEIDKKLDQIVDYSELGDFVNSPVRTYSSGMYMRLAFSVAINVEPDILLIDEILAVGDERFQKKCFSKMKELKSQGCTLVIVSHSLNDIKKVCDEVIWLSEGVPKLIGDCEYVIDQYRSQMIKENSAPMKINEEVSVSKAIDNNNDRLGSNNNIKVNNLGGKAEVGITPNKWGSQEAEINDVKVMNVKGEITNIFSYGEDIVIKYDFRVNAKIENVIFGLGIFLQDGTRCYGTNTELANISFPEFQEGYRGTVKITFRQIYLNDGDYLINLAVHNKDGMPFDYHHRLYGLKVYSGSKDIGIIRPETEWTIS